ncbi:MAG: PKD domain-containing protein [Bacteroidetes bacterium]|nr:PKD domain-containing protein [Bacteroidota bacterium]
MKRILNQVWLAGLCVITLNVVHAQNSTTYRGLSNENGILRFESQMRFDEIIEDLRRESAEYAATHQEEEWPCHIDDPVLENFESDLGFTSLRKTELLRECSLLDRGSKPENLPQTRFPDPFLSTLLNEKAQVKIGGDIIYIVSDDLSYLIKGGSRTTLNQLEAGANPWQFPEVEISMVGGDCSANFTVNASQNSNTVNLNYNGQPLVGVDFLWEFGDGATSTLENPSHTFVSDGEYEICLNIEVSGESPCVDRVCKKVVVGDDFCVAAFIYNETGSPGQICFSDASNIIEDVVSWEWNFGDGSSSDEQNPCHTYTCDKTYYATLTITTVSGCSSTFFLPVFVNSNNCCGWKASNDGYIEYNNGANRIYYYQAQISLPWFFFNKVVATQINYKKKSNGKWKRSKAELKITLDGDVYLKGSAGCKCQNPYPLDYTDSKYGKSLTVLRSIGKGFKAKIGEEWNAAYKVNNNLIHDQDITVTCD